MVSTQKVNRVNKSLKIQKLDLYSVNPRLSIEIGKVKFTLSAYERKINQAYLKALYFEIEEW